MTDRLEQVIASHKDCDLGKGLGCDACVVIGEVEILREFADGFKEKRDKYYMECQRLREALLDIGLGRTSQVRADYPAHARRALKGSNE